MTGEQPGVMPGPEWMAIHYPRERWSQAYTANVSIGQGYDLVSPLQLAMVYATVANGGVSYYPRLVRKILNQNGRSRWMKRASRSFRPNRGSTPICGTIFRRNRSSWCGADFGKW